MENAIKAKVTNLRKNGKCIFAKFRPVFKIIDAWDTTGEIELIDTDKLEVGESAEAYIRFMYPEKYSQSMWIGREIEFYEGCNVAGKAKVIEVYIDSLLKQ